MVRSVAVGAVVLALWPGAVAAQGVAARGIELWVGQATWSGDEVESVDPGVQGGLAVLAETAPHFAFGLEVYVGGYKQLEQDVSELGANVLARWSLGPASGLHLFLQGRIGWSRLSAASITQDGLVVGPELGLEIPLSGRLHLVAAGGGTYRSYESPRLGSGGFVIADGGASGYLYGGRVGLSIQEIF